MNTRKTRWPASLSALLSAVSASLLLCAVLPPALAAAGLQEPEDPEEPASATGEPARPDAELSAGYSLKLLEQAKELFDAQRDKVPREEMLKRYEELSRLRTPPCELGRSIASLPACTTPEECAAYRLWTERMPEGPMAALPDPHRLPGALPATGPAGQPSAARPPRPIVWPGTQPCFAGR